jgi:hypothetical protein
MAVEQAYDTTNLEVLRLELKQLNADAIRTGLLRPRSDDAPDDHPPARSKRQARSSEAKPRPGSAEKGKAGAKRMLALLGRVSGDESLPVPGTPFTESGVVRLLAHLSKPRKKPPAGHRFLQRLHRFLTRPVQMGVRTSAGVSVDRLKLVGRYLTMIETHGWDHFQAFRAARRGRTVRPRPAEPPSIRTAAARKRTRVKPVVES